MAEVDSRTEVLRQLEYEAREYVADTEDTVGNYEPLVPIDADHPLREAVEAVRPFFGGKLPKPASSHWKRLRRLTENGDAKGAEHNQAESEAIAIADWAAAERGDRANVGENEPDGPCGINQWRIDGRILNGELSGKPGKVAEYLFGRIGRKCRIGDVIDELNLGRVQDDAVRKNGSKAAAWFMERNTPFFVETGDGHIWMRDGRKTDE